MKNFEHGGNVYNAEGLAENWLDLSANINPLGLSEAVKSAIVNNIDSIIHYPDPEAKELKSAIAARYKINVDSIITLNGAAEFFYLFFNTFRPKRVLIIVPSFSEYERSAIAAGCEVKYFFTDAENNFNIDFDKLIKIVKAENIDCLVLASPNNPTGNIIDAKNILQILNIIKFTMVDESFIDFLGDDFSIRQLVKQHKNLIVVQSLTKFFAIPGLRLGFAVADESIINRLELGKDVWNVNYLAQKAGVAALNDKVYINKTHEWIFAEKKYIVERLKKFYNVKFFNPTVNFVLIQFATEEIASLILNAFKVQKILLRNCANFVGLDGRYIRMAIRSREENCRAIDLLEKLEKGSEYHKF